MPVEITGGEVWDNDEHAAGLMVIEMLLSEKLLFEIFFLDNRLPDTQLSVTRTVKFHVPAAEGTPLIKPDEFMFSPEGRDPDMMLKVRGA